MMVLVPFVFGLIIWIVLWAIGAKADDAFLPAIVLVLGGAIARLASPYVRDLLKP